jgi:hypothetical protein
MSNKIHELSRGDLDEVSGGLRNFPTSPLTLAGDGIEEQKVSFV